MRYAVCGAASSSLKSKLAPWQLTPKLGAGIFLVCIDAHPFADRGFTGVRCCSEQHARCQRQRTAAFAHRFLVPCRVAHLDDCGCGSSWHIMATLGRKWHDDQHACLSPLDQWHFAASQWLPLIQVQGALPVASSTAAVLRQTNILQGSIKPVVKPAISHLML